MIRRSTVRLLVAIIATLAGAGIAIVAGRPEAALLVAPWMVMLVLGLSVSGRQDVSATAELRSDRVIVGDRVELVVTVEGADGVIEATVRPDETSWVEAPTADRGTINRGAINRGAGDDEADDAGGDQRGDGASDGTDGPACDPTDPEATDGPGEPDERRSVAKLAVPDHPTELTCALRAPTWGSHDIGRVGLKITERYGLIRWTGLLRQPLPIRVHPRPNEVRELLAPWFVRRTAGNHRSRTVGAGVEYADIRPYAPGDSHRDINWRASARGGELLVSQRHPDRSTEVILLLDSFVESGHDARSVLGIAIEAAVALADSHLAVTDRVGLVELGGVVRWVHPATGRHQLQRITEALLATRLYAYSADRDVAVIPPRALPPRSFVVALSPLYDRRFNDALLAVRARGHDVAVIDCSPIDEDPGSIGATSDSARLALRLWLAERAMTIDRLAEQGVMVGRWQPDQPIDPVLSELIARRRGLRIGAGR